MSIFLSSRSLKLTIDPIDVVVPTCRTRGRGRPWSKRGINRPLSPVRTQCAPAPCSSTRQAVPGCQGDVIFRRCRPIIVCFMHVRLFGMRRRCQWCRQRSTPSESPRQWVGGHRKFGSPATPAGRTVTGLPRRAKKLRQPASESQNRAPCH